MTSSPPSSHLTAAVSTECPALPDGNYGQGLRSIWHLSRHLTARADDNHAAPSQEPRRAQAAGKIHTDIERGFIRAEVIAYEDMIRCGSVAAASISPTASIHRLPCGLPGDLILCDTHTFEHERQLQFSKLPSQSGFFVISKHFTATPRIPPASTALKETSINCNFTVEPQTFTTDLISRLRSP